MKRVIHNSKFIIQARSAFTLIELIVTIGVIAIVSLGILVALNPVGQLAAARNSQRQSHLQSIMNGIRQNVVDNRQGNVFNCAAGDIPTTTTKKMASGSGNYDIYSCLVPTYLFSLPVDPSTSTAYFNSAADYDTAYTITKNASSGAVTLAAPAAELKKVISITR